jgi:hypothetical protein
MVEDFKLLKGYNKWEIITSELNPDLSIRLEMLSDNMLRIQITLRFSINQYLRKQKVVRMRGTFDEYVMYSHLLHSNFYAIRESQDNNIARTLDFMMDNYDE